MISGEIFDIKKYAIHDGPGIRTTVFFKGCPLSCWWCHNPESLGTAPQRIYRRERCIGCQECLAACPFGAMQYDDDRETAVKCDLCMDRLKNDQTPACYSVCPTRCISWGATKSLSERIVQEVLPQKMK